jgi:hypothetical protein
LTARRRYRRLARHCCSARCSRAPVPRLNTKDWSAATRFARARRSSTCVTAPSRSRHSGLTRNVEIMNGNVRFPSWPVQISPMRTSKMLSATRSHRRLVVFCQRCRQCLPSAMFRVRARSRPCSQTEHSAQCRLGEFENGVPTGGGMSLRTSGFIFRE